MATLKIKITENQFFHYNNTYCIENSDLAQMVGHLMPKASVWDFSSSEPDKSKTTEKIPSNRVPLQEKGHFDAHNSMIYSLQSMLIVIYTPLFISTGYEAPLMTNSLCY